MSLRHIIDDEIAQLNLQDITTSGMKSWIRSLMNHLWDNALRPLAVSNPWSALIVHDLALEVLIMYRGYTEVLLYCEWGIQPYSTTLPIKVT